MFIFAPLNNYYANMRSMESDISQFFTAVKYNF